MKFVFFPPSKVYVSIANARCVDEHDIIDWHIGEHADIIQVKFQQILLKRSPSLSHMSLATIF